MAQYIEISEIQEEVYITENIEHDVSVEAWQEPLERQRELNDNLALVRILDDPSPFGEFGPFASEPASTSSKYRRQTLLNFIAFCLSRDDNTVAVATTIQRLDKPPHAAQPQNRLVLHVARSTGFTTSYEREHAFEFLNDLKRAWKFQTSTHMQIVLGNVMQMTAGKLRKRLKKLRNIMRDLRGVGGFFAAVDMWGKEEKSPDVSCWMNTWHCESQNMALKDVFQQLSASADTDDFDAPDLLSPRGQFRLYHSYFFPITVLIGSRFLREVEFSQTTLAPPLVRLLRRLRRRCIKLRWYEIGVHLLCTYAKDAVRRILGVEAFTKFLCIYDDTFHIDWLETPNAVSEPMHRGYDSAQDALLGVLASLSDDSDGDEPYACNITHRVSTLAYWTPSCMPVYHPELQIIDYLRRRHMRPSPTYVGCSRLVCRACKFYVDQLGGDSWSLYTGGLDTMELEVPEEWLIPPTNTGVMCASIVREEAARLVLREDNLQRIAWELRTGAESIDSESEAMATDE